MSYGPKQVFTCGIASGASSSSFIDLGDKSYSQMSVYFSTMTTATVMTVYGAIASAATYFPISERVNTSTVQYQPITIATAASGTWCSLPALPARFIKFVGAETIVGGSTLTVIAQD